MTMTQGQSSAVTKKARRLVPAATGLTFDDDEAVSIWSRRKRRFFVCEIEVEVIYE
jgi:hypothetical protein